MFKGNQWLKSNHQTHAHSQNKPYTIRFSNLNLFYKKNKHRNRVCFKPIHDYVYDGVFWALAGRERWSILTCHFLPSPCKLLADRRKRNHVNTETTIRMTPAMHRIRRTAVRMKTRVDLAAAARRQKRIRFVLCASVSVGKSFGKSVHNMLITKYL